VNGSGSGSTGGSGLPGSGVSTAGAETSGTSGAASGVGGTGASGAATGSGSGASSGGAAGDNSVLERGKRPSRDGNYVQPTLTTMAVAKTMPDAAFNMKATFKGAMFSSPLYLEQGPGGKGIFIASSTTNDVTAFDDTGAQVWTRNVGNAASGWPMVKCGGVRPIGIMGTPVIDPAPGPDGLATIYVSAAVAAAAGGTVDHYELHALSAKDGSERTGWPAKIDKTVVAKNDGLNVPFDPGLHAQRPALSLVNGVVYVGFGGPQGDCGLYRGWVMAVDTKNPATVGAWTTRLGGGAIWSPGGFASDGNGVIVTTGNYYAGAGYGAPPMYGDSESIIRITGMPNAPTRSDAYYPARWRELDTLDQDLGSSSVMLLQVPGATPSTYGVTGSKDGHLYFVNSAMLGMMGGGGEIIDLPLSQANGHSGRISAVAYTTASGIHIAITIDRGVVPPGMTVAGVTGCPAMNVKLPSGAAQPPPDPAMAVLMGLTVTPGAPIKVTPAWCTTIGGPTMNDAGTIKNRSASPLVTTTDGKSSPIVWVGGSTTQAAAALTANMLYGVDGETGAILYSGGNCVGIRQWTTPIAVKGHIVLGGDGHLCSWSPQ